MDLYGILGVDRSVSVEQLKSAYRKMAIENHPDRGGDGKVFSAIAMAYGVLADPEKRKRYDETGETGPLRTVEQLLRAIVVEAFRQSRKDAVAYILDRIDSARRLAKVEVRKAEFECEEVKKRLKKFEEKNASTSNQMAFGFVVAQIEIEIAERESIVAKLKTDIEIANQMLDYFNDIKSSGDPGASRMTGALNMWVTA